MTRETLRRRVLIKSPRAPLATTLALVLASISLIVSVLAYRHGVASREGDVAVLTADKRTELVEHIRFLSHALEQAKSEAYGALTTLYLPEVIDDMNGSDREKQMGKIQKHIFSADLYFGSMVEHLNVMADKPPRSPAEVQELILRVKGTRFSAERVLRETRETIAQLDLPAA